MNQAHNDMPDGSRDIFTVGDLRVDVGRQRVTRDGTVIPLPNLSFQLLMALIRSAPNVVSYDALMKQVWPGLVVSPETVIKRAKLLREALGDDSREPRYIAGVRGHGYRLDADVARAPKPAPPVEAVEPGAPSVTPRNALDRIAAASQARGGSSRQIPRQWLWLSALLTIALAFPIMRWVIKARGTSVPVATEIQQPAISPVGTRAGTVAVLPFENLSADAADAYLARGLPEMILNRLSHVSGLRVIAGNSSFALTTASMDTRDIARRLSAGFLINGSVQRKADRLRVTVQLVDAGAGTQIWSASSDRALNDIFTVEDEIAEQVAGALSARVGGIETKLPADKRSGNIEAYFAYLRGRALLGRLTVAESESAVPYFEKAIALDPSFAAAYASLYDARMQAADQRHENLAPVRQRYRPLIDRALAIDPDSGSAYFARAMWGGGTNAEREVDFRKGAALDPSNGRGLTAYAEFLDGAGVIGRPDEAGPMLERALQIDPMSPRVHFYAAIRSGDQIGIAAAEAKMQAILEIDPAFVPAIHEVALYRWIIDDKMVEAVQLLEHAITLDPGAYLPRHTAMAVYLDLGDVAAARAVAGDTHQSAYGRPLLALNAGDWRAAGLAAFDESNWIHDLECQNWLVPEALRDYALKTGEVGRAIAFIRTKFLLPSDSAQLDVCTYQAALVLSQLLALHGQAQESRALRRRVEAWNDANAAKYGGGTSRVRAEALLMDERRDEALEALAEDFRSGDHRQWWYTLKYDPVWLPLHGDSRFRAIAADVRRFVDSERNQLEVLRRRGDVPDERRREPARRDETP